MRRAVSGFCVFRGALQLPQNGFCNNTRKCNVIDHEWPELVLCTSHTCMFLIECKNMSGTLMMIIVGSLPPTCQDRSIAQPLYMHNARHHYASCKGI